MYRNLLEQHVIHSIRAAPIQLAIFMNNNASCHTINNKENILIIKWPAQT